MSAKGLTLAPYTAEPMFVDDVRFSNAATVEHNVLGPGEVGHILRSRTTTLAGGAYALADAWFAFNQVGSVVNHSNAAGAMTQAVEMDAWGNTLASAASGAWGTQQEGFGFQSKRYSALSGSHYFWLRHSDSQTGRFLSQAPYPAFREHPYSALAGDPMYWVDPYGAEEQKSNWWNPSDWIKYCIVKPRTDGAFAKICCEIDRWRNRENAANGHPAENRADAALHDIADLGTEACVAAACTGGSLVAENGAKITGFTKHGINRAIGDGAKRAGVKPAAVLDALRNPRRVVVNPLDASGRPTIVFHGRDARVVINPETGKIVSTNPLTGAGAHR